MQKKGQKSILLNVFPLFSAAAWHENSKHANLRCPPVDTDIHAQGGATLAPKYALHGRNISDMPARAAHR